MNIIIWLLAGALIGWMGSSIIRTDAQIGIIPNVVVGAIGAGLAGWLLSPLVDASMINGNSLSITSLLVSLAGAAALLTLVNVAVRSRAK